MTSTKILVIVAGVLVIIGLAGLLYGGITYTKSQDTTTLGPLEFTVSEKKHLPIHPAVGGVLLLAGGAILVVSIRRT